MADWGTMPARLITTDGPFDLVRTLAPLRRGPADRTIHLAAGRARLALATASGDATLAVDQDGTFLRCEAWGPGAEDLLARADDLLGLTAARPDLAGPSPLIAELARRFPGIRLPRTRVVMASLVPAILEQKVTGDAARRSWFQLIRMLGRDAPRPSESGLRLPPSAAVLAAMPYYDFHPLGVERRRADLIRRVSSRAAWYEAAADLPLDEAHARLTAMSGLGPWTAAEVAVRAFGDADAVSVGDFHLKHLVSFALAGEPRGTDERMVELLAPYVGRRAHVIRLLELSGIRPPRYGPRLTPRRFETD